MDYRPGTDALSPHCVLALISVAALLGSIVWKLCALDTAQPDLFAPESWLALLASVAGLAYSLYTIVDFIQRV
jgi:hypothetical protein